MSKPNCNPLIDNGCGHVNIFFRPFDFPNGGDEGDNAVELEGTLFFIELEDSTDIIILE